MINRLMIKQKQPCSGAYIELLEKYGKDFEVSYQQLLKDFPQYSNWITSHLFCYREKLSPEYSGKFKIDQLIYMN